MHRAKNIFPRDDSRRYILYGEQFVLTLVHLLFNDGQHRPRWDMSSKLNACGNQWFGSDYKGNQSHLTGRSWPRRVPASLWYLVLPNDLNI